VVINALKYAFPDGGGKILVRYDVDGANWRLSVSDNGVGLRKNGRTNTGLGTNIVEALAKQPNAHVEILSGPHGTTVSISHETSIADKCVSTTWRIPLGRGEQYCTDAIGY
jgi:two-component sensor histidine kinase